MTSSHLTRQKWLPMPFAGLAVTMVITLAVAMAADDPHGGVKMGEVNIACDDGVHGADIDWNVKNSEPYLCTGPTIKPGSLPPHYEHENETRAPLHVCLKNNITYTSIPLSGAHRPLWPVYGEYVYCPPQRWVHSLEHAALVFVYHPCADKSEVDTFRKLVTGCLRKHLISPSKLLSIDRPFGLITWGNGLFLDHFDQVNAINFIKKHAMQDGPEWRVVADGKYEIGLIKKAEVVGGDIWDREVCKVYEDGVKAGRL